MTDPTATEPTPTEPTRTEPTMTEPTTTPAATEPAGSEIPPDVDLPSPESVESRAHLLPEERAAGGSDDPRAQAEAILQESWERTQDPEHQPGDDDTQPAR